jgi:RHS repeat-associated protein
LPHPEAGSTPQHSKRSGRQPTSQRSQRSTYPELPHSPAGAIAPRTNRGELVRRAGAAPRAPACGGITIDALNRVTSITAPDDSLLEPLYNEASLLETLSVYLRGATTATPIIKDLDYNAKGQRTRIQYAQTPGSGTAPFATEYQYDELTFRLKRLITTRVSPSNTLQDLRYEFDPVGNIIRIQDDAQQSLFYDDAFVAPENLYTYDAVYRLIEATGREHASIGNTQLDHNDQPIRNLPLPTDPSAVRSYLETYTYDRIGNLLELFHSAGGGANTWTRTYAYVSGTNQLASNTIPGGSATYTHDAHGSITSMPHLASITYGPFDQMANADLGGGGDAYYQYDASGQRVRKLIDTGANLIKERIYLGAYEVYREHISGGVDLERQSLHVMDGTRRVALLETLTIEDGDPVTNQRFQLGNHLDSALLEVDEAGMVVSYEELLPYGASAYRSARSGVEVSARRYRYTGKERDDETGLYYHGARYYAAWLGRWTSADPLGIGADGPGLYNYTRGSPVVLVDPTGGEPMPPPAAGVSPPPPPPPPPGKPPSFGQRVSAATRSIARGLRQASSASAGGSPPPTASATASSGGESSVLGNVLSGAAEEVGHKASSLAKGVIDHPLQTLQSATPLGAGAALVIGAVSSSTRIIETAMASATVASGDESQRQFGKLLVNLVELALTVAPFVKGGKTGKGSSSDPLSIADDIKLDFGSDPDFGLKPRFEVPKSGAAPASAGAATGSTILRVGDVLGTADDVLANPQLLSGKSVGEVRMMIDRTPGWSNDVMRRSTKHPGGGWVFREMNAAGTEFTGRMIQYHPGTPRHYGGAPYWKVSGIPGQGPVRIPLKQP